MLNIDEFSRGIQTALRVLVQSNEYHLTSKEVVSLATEPWESLSGNVKKVFTSAVASRMALELPRIRQAAINAAQHEEEVDATRPVQA